MDRDLSRDGVLAPFMALAFGAASGCSTLVGIEEGVLDSPPCAPGCEDEREGPCSGCALGCLPPWQLEDPATGHCYLVERDYKKQWQAAGIACEDIGASLAALTSAAELDLIRPLIRESTWIGGSDLTSNDDYAWSNGEPWWPMAPWVSGGPDSDDDKHCVKLSSQPPIAFDDAGCSSKLAYLCEKP